jgi:ribonuclease BN (tRNA processing enzyme)
VELRHDGPTFGFRVEAKPGRGARPVALGYVADTGSWSDLMAETLAEVDLLGVEFNHDVEMQRRSGRSAALIARNLGDRGHLSNEQGAGLLAAVLRQSGPAAVRHVVLLHLSQQCNRPNLALRAARASLRGEGRRASVHAARQATAHPDLLVTASRRRSVAAAGRPRVAGRSPTPDFRFPENPVPGPAGDDA